MIGSAMSFAGYMLVLFVLSIWMVVKLWRSSPLLAILSFLFWPVSIFALIKYWGDDDSDIRVPFFLSVLVGGLAVFMAYRAVDKAAAEMALELSAEEIEAIRQENPELAAMMDQARADAGLAPGEDFDDEDGYGDDESSETSAAEAASAARQNAPKDAATIEAETRANLEQAALGLSWQFGKLDLAPVPAMIQIPSHFRFAPRITLPRLARARNAALAADVLGWLVHRDVDLAREDAWYVQVRYRALDAALLSPGAAPADKAEALAQQAIFVARLAAAVDPASTAKPDAATWDAANGIATWRRAGSVAESTERADYVAVRVLGNGALEFVMPDLHEAHAELGQRAVRMMALRATAAAPAPPATAAR